MADKPVYASFIGFVQFDPQTREVGEQTVRNVTIRTLNSNKNVYCTLWPSHAKSNVIKGDLIAVEGKYQKRISNGNEYHNLDVSLLHNLGAGTRGNRPEPSAKSKDDDWA